MKREIKFRVWDKSVPTYAEVMEEKEATGQMINWEYAKESSYLIDAIHGQYPIMQFTGLLDKNGVEIYEGDIVNWLQAAGGIINSDPVTKICEIVWEHNGWYVVDRSAEKNGFFGRYTFASCHIEVIGNIYENPELLDQQ